ncbi:MAG: hypothetical protein QM689_11325 [Oscillospiraceae bacterium]
MKIIEVYVSAVDRTYDFKLDENVPLYLLAEEICEMVCQKEQCNIQGDTNELLFYRNSSNGVASMHRTIHEIGIRTGEKLTLI